jgi:predicted nucleic acid-binding protein
MSDRVFVDTNILVYAHDAKDGRKQAISKGILRGLTYTGAGVVSMQVLQEFYNTVTRKLEFPLPRNEARAIVADLSHFCIKTVPDDLLTAFQVEDQAKISFWDAMIVSAAIKAGATSILSEDLNAGQVIGGVRIENPFAGA